MKWAVPCRCGATYEIEQQGSGQVAYECEDCSLSVLVTYEEKL
jgi:DNA-directed RNA polymerase subunit RPC12/RpoP